MYKSFLFGIIIGSIFYAIPLPPKDIDLNNVQYEQVNPTQNVDSEISKEIENGVTPACPNDMEYVVGTMLVGDSDYIEQLQNSTCTKWISKQFPERCDSFDRDKWIKLVDKLPRKYLSFCIDKFEYPNKEGQQPQVCMTWGDAKQICQSQNKRLCTEEEWTFACEGEESTPYPYGYDRKSDFCGIDKEWIEPNYTKLYNPETQQEEIDRLWQGHNSGANLHCKSIFGVYDMTGNVDEITMTVRNTGYPSILKGGYWAKVRDRCRPSTRAHNQWYKNYQLGFRCCTDSKE